MRRVRLVLIGASVLALVGVGLPGLPAHAARTYTVSPGADLKAAFERLRAGDTLRLNPGTYNVSGGGALRPNLAAGSPSARITVTAADPSRKPVLQGRLFLKNARYWNFFYLRVQATVPGAEAVFMAGGTGWAIREGEFWGASATGAYANVAIGNADHTNTATAPKGWQFAQNCVHDAGRGTAAGHGDTDHNIYVIASGDADGVISRNTLFNATSGSQIKIGNGGDRNAVGASNIRIEYNLTYNANHQILIFGNLKSIMIKGNLMMKSNHPRTPVGIYLNNLRYSGGVYVAHNYAYLLKPVVFAPSPTTSAMWRNGGDNRIGGDPRMSNGCAFRPANPDAAKYGRWSTVSY
ncbi:MAG: hypothetical protein U0Q15_04560 [Kineosporiaceae bacterium]